MRINARVDALRLALLLDDALEDDAGGVRVPGPGRGGDGEEEEAFRAVT